MSAVELTCKAAGESTWVPEAVTQSITGFVSRPELLVQNESSCTTRTLLIGEAVIVNAWLAENVVSFPVPNAQGVADEVSVMTIAACARAGAASRPTTRAARPAARGICRRKWFFNEDRLGITPNKYAMSRHISHPM